MTRLKQKLRGKAGFTLTELLLAVAILGILFATIVVGVNAAAKVYRRSVAFSDAQTLTSTLSEALSNELRYARNIKAGAGSVSFDSDTFGAGVSVSSPGGRITVGRGTQQYKLLSDSAYTSGLTAGANVSYAAGLFTVTLTVSAAELSPLDTTFTVSALNSGSAQ